MQARPQNLLCVVRGKDKRSFIKKRYHEFVQGLWGRRVCTPVKTLVSVGFPYGVLQGIYLRIGTL